MGYMIEITENKVNEMSELVEKMLKYGGKLMHCIDEMGMTSMDEWVTEIQCRITETIGMTMMTAMVKDMVVAEVAVIAISITL